MKKVLPCPFCGLAGEIMVWTNKAGDIDLIEHPNTGCVMSDVRCYDVDAWNERVPQEPNP